jgi:hypothetical protein
LIASCEPILRFDQQELTRPNHMTQVRFTNPLNWVQRSIGGALADNAEVSNGVAAVVNVATGGAQKAYIRLKSSAAGDLDAALLRPDGQTAYTTGAPTTVPVLANTEVEMEVDVNGVGEIKVTFTPSGDGVVSYCDVSFA